MIGLKENGNEGERWSVRRAAGKGGGWFSGGALQGPPGSGPPGRQDGFRLITHLTAQPRPCGLPSILVFPFPDGPSAVIRSLPLLWALFGCSC